MSSFRKAAAESPFRMPLKHFRKPCPSSWLASYWISCIMANSARPLLTASGMSPMLMRIRSMPSYWDSSRSVELPPATATECPTSSSRQVGIASDASCRPEQADSSSDSSRMIRVPLISYWI